MEIVEVSGDGTGLEATHPLPTTGANSSVLAESLPTVYNDTVVTDDRT